MINILNLIGNLILLFLGFIISILTISVSIFSDGIKIIKDRQERERAQTLENINKQTSKSGTGLNVEDILKDLKKKERLNNRSLRYLSLKGLLLWNSIPTGVSFLALLVLVFVSDKQNLSYHTLILIGATVTLLSSFCYGVYNFYQSLNVISEASIAKNQNITSSEEDIKALLATLVENTKKDSAPSTFAKGTDLKVEINGENVISGKEFIFAINTPQVLKIKLINRSSLMLKEPEIGLTFPLEFLVERKVGDRISSVVPSETNQYIRFNKKFIYSNEGNALGAVNIKFLNAGIFDVKAFVKGENLVPLYINFKIKVVV